MNSQNNTTLSQPLTAECNSSNDTKFLGIVDKRYIRTFYGLIHGIGSTKALVRGNIVFLNRVLLGNQSLGSANNTIFHTANFVATLITAIFFWNKVQSWQLSTTTMKEKGVTPRTLQRFNQGRGVVTMLLYSLIPFAYAWAPNHFLESQVFSCGLALALIAGSAFCYNLIKDYGKHLWLVYGMTPMALGFTILSNSEHTLASVQETTPLVMDRFQKESCFVISCVQLGFMMYYLYSRNRVTKATVQKTCKTYHVTIAMIFLFRAKYDLLMYFIKRPSSTIPWPMLVQPVILAIFSSSKILKALGTKVTTKQEKQEQPQIKPQEQQQKPQEVAASVERIQSIRRSSSKRRSSARRRSSLANRIEFSCSVCQ